MLLKTGFLDTAQDKLYKMAKSHPVPILDTVAHNPSEVKTSGTAFCLWKQQVRLERNDLFPESKAIQTKHEVPSNFK